MILNFEQFLDKEFIPLVWSTFFQRNTKCFKFLALFVYPFYMPTKVLNYMKLSGNMDTTSKGGRGSDSAWFCFDSSTFKERMWHRLIVSDFSVLDFALGSVFYWVELGCGILALPIFLFLSLVALIRSFISYYDYFYCWYTN